VPSLTGSSNFRAGTEHSNRGGPGRSALQLQREAARPHSSIAGPLRQGRPAPRSTPHNVARNVGGDDRHNAFPGQFFHEQIQKARIHQVQWRTSDQYFSPQCRPARVIDNFRPTSGTSCTIQCGLEEGGGGRESVPEKTCLAEGGRLCMWLRNVTNFQISCSLKTFFQPGMAVQRIPCCKM